ncbi:carboxypeptidase-like regulatory domain-containing protein [Chitinophaga caeni]|nr:carboxypeptidase-like regulatory domain-containing protein [Chitinophaga caeni]
MKKLVIIFIVLCVSNCSLYSQNKTIKGKVITDDLEIVPLASIMINDTVEIGRTDLNGFFQIDIPASEKKILFRSVGLEPAIIELVDTCNEVEVVMMLSGTYDFKTLKKVDRLRKKKFKKLPALHKEAFVKGIFKTDKACYTQEFIPHYKKKQK